MLKIRKENIILYLKEIPNFLSIFIYPMFFVIPSVLLVDISNSLNTAPERINIIFSFYTIGNAIGLVITVFLNRRFKKIDIVLYSYAILVLFILFIIFFKLILMFFISFFAIGLISGVIWLQAYNYLLENEIKNKDKLLNIAMVFHPIGAFASPYLAYFSVSNNSEWTLSFWVIIIIIVINILLYLFIIKLRSTENIIGDRDRVSLKEIFVSRKRNIFFIFTIMAIFTYFMAEGVFITWSPTFLRIYRTINMQKTSMYFSFFYIGLGSGRLLVSIFSERLKPLHMLIALSVLSVAGFSIVNFYGSDLLLILGILLTGLGLSGISPLLFSTGGTSYEKGRGVLASFMFIAANSGIAVVPILIRGALNAGFQHLLMIPVFLIILALFFILSRFYLQKI
jgi:MFS family permease